MIGVDRRVAAGLCTRSRFGGSVIPAKAGIQAAVWGQNLDSGFRRNDERGFPAVLVQSRAAVAIRVITALVIAACPAPASAAPYPLDVARAFCQADGAGARLRPATWPAIAPLVTWQLEPAWDRVRLVSGYQIHPPRFVVDHVEIDVQYTVVADIEAEQITDTASFSSVTLVLVGDDTAGWRITGPPPPPHVFASQFDAGTLRHELGADSSVYLSDSVFVWRMLRDAGWAIPYRSVRQLRAPEVFAAVTDPKPGDLALYFAATEPYHVGFITADGQVASATANVGLMRTSPDVFEGAILYLRLKQSSELKGPGTEQPPAAVTVMQPRPTRTAKPAAKSAVKFTRRSAARPAHNIKRPTATPRRAGR
jgi:hypothetical protein